jgi:hypothetical protein
MQVGLLIVQVEEGEEDLVVVLRVRDFRDFSSPNLLILFGKTRLESDSSTGSQISNFK